MNQSDVVRRIEEICQEFDGRVEKVRLPIARLELAKALAESEATCASLKEENKQLREAIGDAMIDLYQRESAALDTGNPAQAYQYRKIAHDLQTALALHNGE